jgi:hypothetical protein
MVATLIASLSTPAAKSAIRAILTIASFAYQQAQMNRMKAEADKRKGFVFTVRGKAEDIPVCYGKNLLGGIAVKHKVTSGFTSATDNSDKTFAEDFTNSNKSGSKNEFLHVQYALCRAGIEGVQWAKVNNIHYNDSDAKFKHLIRTFNGGDAITAVSDNIATANGIDSNNLFTNVAFASTTYRLNRNDYNYNGDPEVGFLIKGQKVPWIVRSGTSGNYTYAIKKSGSNIQDQYSNNPVRCLLDYLLNDKYGRGLSESEVDLESFYNATDVADTIVATDRTVGGKVNGQKEIITVPNLSNRPGNLEKRTYENILWYTSNTSQYWYWNKTAWVETEFDTKRPIPLYECNITLDTGDTIRNNMERILSTMGQAELTWSSEGKYKILLEYPTSLAEQLALVNSEHYFNEDSIIRDTVKLSWPSASDRVNQATVDFLNEHEDFKEDSMTWPPFSSEPASPYQVYRTQDGSQPFHSRMNLDGVTDPYHALAKAEQIVRQQRLFHNIELVVSKKGLSLEPGDFINITLPQSDIDTTVTTYVGGAAQPRYIYRVQSIEINSDFTVKIEAYSFNYQDLAWNVNDDIAFITQPLFDFTLDPPLSGTFTFDGGNVLGTNSGRLDWIVANDINAIEYLIEISSNNGTTWNELGTTTSNTFDVQGLQTGVYDFSIRSRSSLGSLSTRLLIENKTIQLKTVEKVAVIYANNNNLATNTQSYTKGSNEFVAFKNYDSDLPTLPIRTGLTFARFVGISIGSISKSGDDVTVNYTDGTSDGFVVNGVSSVSKVNGVLTITYDDGTTSTLIDGEDGNGINTVTKSGTTVTVTYDDGTTNTFTVEDGVDSIQGDPDYVTVSNISKTGSGSYSANVLDIDFTFNQSATVVAKRRYRVTRSNNSLSSTISPRDSSISDELNVSRLTPSISIDGASALLTVTYSHGGITSVASAPLNIVSDGIGITSVSKTNETVTVTYDDNSTDNFTVNGVSNVSKSGNQLTITYDDGTTSTIDDGIDGDEGNGIASVSKSGTTVTVTYDDGTTNTFTVADGVDAIYADPDPVTTFSITKDQEANTYSASFIDVDFEFRQGSNAVARRRYRLARSGDTWGNITTRDGDISNELNVSRLSASKNVSGQTATMKITYSHGGITSIGTATLNIIFNNNKGDDGQTGERGAGWWRYQTGNSNSTSGLSNTTLNSYFATATGLTVVAGDRLIVSNDNDEATGYLRNNANTSWTEQAEFIDGDLLVNGTVTANALAADSVTADKIDVTNLKAVSATLGDVDIDNTLELSGPVSGFIAGRTSTADFGTEGFYIGRTSTTGNTATGFQLSHTSLASNNHPQLSSGTLQGLIHDDVSGLRIYEPVFYQRGTANASGGLITTNNQNIALSKGDIHTVTVIGGGGGGGHGAQGNYFTSNRPGGGGGTTTATLNGASGYNGTRTYSASGGAGGLGGFYSGANSDESGGNSANGGNAGEASVFGPGGYGNSPDAPSASYGAGGAGGSGINTSNTTGENGGDGGSHGQTLTITFDLTNANNNGTLTANAIGAGGAGHTYSSATGDGGDGRKGAIAVAGVLDGYKAITLEDMYDPVYLSGAEKLASNNYPTNQSYPSGNSFNGGTNGRWGYLSYTGSKSNRGPFNFSGAGSWIKIGETYSSNGVIGPISGVEYYLAPGGSISINSNDTRYLDLNYVDL